MLKNLVKQTLRGLSRDKFHSLINIFGLGLGIACCLIGLLFVQSELRYDKHHTKHGRIFRYGVEMTIGGVTSIQSSCNPGAGPLLKDFIPEIESLVRIGYLGEILVKDKDRAFSEENLIWADPGIFNMFSHPFVYGNRKNALNRDNTMVLTQTLAQKIFGHKNSLGEVLEIENQGQFEITGVVADPPDNDQLQFSALLSFSTQFKGLNQTELYQPSRLSGDMGYDLYFLFAPGFTAADFDKKAKQFYDRFMAATDHIHYRSLVEPLTAVHLQSRIDSVQAAANSRFLFWFCGIVLLILFLAGVNYVNLTTSRAGKRAKEIGVRKVIGSSHGQLLVNLLGESLFFVFLALLAGIVLAHGILSLTPLNQVVGKKLAVNIFSNPFLLLGLLAIWIIVSLLAGLYPAFYLARISPMKTLASRSGGQRSGRFIRQGLLVVQFVIAIGAIALTLLMNRQLNFIKSKDLGFTKDPVILVNVGDANLRKRGGAYKNEVLRLPGVAAASFSDSVPGSGFTGNAFQWESNTGEMQIFAFGTLQADKDYFQTLGIHIVAGRNFSRPANAQDMEKGTMEFIVTENLVKALGWKDAIGKRNQVGTVVGVVRNFHYSPLHRDVRPTFIVQPREIPQYLNVRLRGGQIRETLAALGSQWKTFAPGYPFAYSFLDQRLARFYEQDQKQQKLAAIFSALCLLISCLGLFALASFHIEQRTKEIGIRKTLGASVANLALLLTGKFVFWVLLANALAWPLAYWAMKQWLQNFAYRTTIRIDIFLLSTAFALLLTLLTVGLQAARAARQNPVESLRYE
ncbi:MAG: ABC transporter permease [Candidatus Aminicenantes bacterium]|nr:ABC transporter permease [Candidatus Aminicenantes bacterium]